MAIEVLRQLARNEVHIRADGGCGAVIAEVILQKRWHFISRELGEGDDLQVREQLLENQAHDCSASRWSPAPAANGVVDKEGDDDANHEDDQHDEHPIRHRVAAAAASQTGLAVTCFAHGAARTLVARFAFAVQARSVSRTVASNRRM